MINVFKVSGKKKQDDLSWHHVYIADFEQVLCINPL